jgi:hypothetical protein
MPPLHTQNINHEIYIYATLQSGKEVIMDHYHMTTMDENIQIN